MIFNENSLKQSDMHICRSAVWPSKAMFHFVSFFFLKSKGKQTLKPSDFPHKNLSYSTTIHRIKNQLHFTYEKISEIQDILQNTTKTEPHAHLIFSVVVIRKIIHAFIISSITAIVIWSCYRIKGCISFSWSIKLKCVGMACRITAICSIKTKKKNQREKSENMEGNHTTSCL